VVGAAGKLDVMVRAELSVAEASAGTEASPAVVEIAVVSSLSLVP
jgi:hypothetical protein